MGKINFCHWRLRHVFPVCWQNGSRRRQGTCDCGWSQAEDVWASGCGAAVHPLPPDIQGNSQICSVQLHCSLWGFATCSMDHVLRGGKLEKTLTEGVCLNVGLCCPPTKTKSKASPPLCSFDSSHAPLCLIWSQKQWSVLLQHKDAPQPRCVYVFQCSVYNLWSCLVVYNHFHCAVGLKFGHGQMILSDFMSINRKLFL